MPGAFAHLTLVNEMRTPAQVRAMGLSKPAAAALNDWLGYVELGAVSPDYPYLAIANGNAARWADLMHYERTGDMLQALIAAVGRLDGTSRAKGFAWMCGYLAHVAADVTIHPVVELKVGPYAENKKAHRICEMHQDAYIWHKRMNLGEVGLCEHLDHGIRRCSDKGGGLDPTVKAVWVRALRDVHPDEAKTNPPDPDKWHAAFAAMVDHIGEEGNKLAPIARHVAVDCGLTYPAPVKVDRAQYIDRLATPGGGTATYDEIFARAMKSVGQSWQAADRAVFARDEAAPRFFGHWNLDTGRDENDELVFWA